MEHQHEKGQWGSSFDFLMAAVGSAVGLGNLWGFPYKMGMNGGFAFLIVYLILVALVGVIICLAELSLGRKSGKGVCLQKGIRFSVLTVCLSPAKKRREVLS